MDQQIHTLQRRLSSVELVVMKRGENKVIDQFGIGVICGSLYILIWLTLYAIKIVNEERKQEREEYEYDY